MSSDTPTKTAWTMQRDAERILSHQAPFVIAPEIWYHAMGVLDRSYGTERPLNILQYCEGWLEMDAQIERERPFKPLPKPETNHA